MKTFIALALLALASSQAVAGDADVKLTTCLRRQASVGGSFGTIYSPNDVGSLVSLVKQCPETWMDFQRSCQIAGGAETDCRLQGMMMALDAAEEFKR